MARKRITGFYAIILISALLPAVFSGCSEVTAGGEDPSVTADTESTEQSEDLKEIDEAETAEIIDITPEEVYEIIGNGGDYVILDVRTEDEYASGHLPGSILIPVQELEDRLGELPADKPVVVYCRSGSRSRRAAETLAGNGFMVYDMGGINGWINLGYPVAE